MTRSKSKDSTKESITRLFSEAYEPPQRPKNAFMIWSKEERKKLKDANIIGKSVMTILGKRWKELPEEDMKKWNSLAEEDRKRHKKECEARSTTPTPSEENKINNVEIKKEDDIQTTNLNKKERTRLRYIKQKKRKATSNEGSKRKKSI